MTRAQAGMPTARAAGSGRLWGEVDCYILDDGQRVIAQRAILRSLGDPARTRGAEEGNFGRFLARLPKGSEELTRGAEIEFQIAQPQRGARRAEEAAVDGPDASPKSLHEACAQIIAGMADPWPGWCSHFARFITMPPEVVQ